MIPFKLFFVIGASGSGKTCALKYFAESIPENCRLVHFDHIGVPTFKEMEREWGSVEQWQRAKTFEWVEKLSKDQLLKSHIVFDAQVRPQFIEEACAAFRVEYAVVLFYCSDPVRRDRLISRGDEGLADGNMMQWARFLRSECRRRRFKIINNTQLTPAETSGLFQAWLNEHCFSRIDVPLVVVCELVAAQFPEYAHLEIKEVVPGGWDNKTFRLGEVMSVRMPSAERYAEKVLIEHSCLSKLGPHLSVAVPQPIGVGHQAKNYPWNWSIYGWIEGEVLSVCQLGEKSLEVLVDDLADFLKELHAIDGKSGPKPGAHNFSRGGALAVYDAEARSVAENVQELVDFRGVMEIWEQALSTEWDKEPVWVHGDLSADNILIKDNHLCGVIDFGGVAVGDPACDLVIAWTFFSGKYRKRFMERLELDRETWNRAKGWALWKALITLDSRPKTESEQLCIIQSLLDVSLTP